MEKGLDDFLIADQVNDLVDYSIEAKLNRVARDRQYRGTIESINGNVADVLLLDASTAITDVKIKSGINLFADEDVYVTAINGSLNNMVINTRVLDIDLLYGVNVANYLLVETFQDYTDWTNDLSTGTISQDEIIKKYNGKAVKFSIDNIVDTYAMKADVSLDLTEFPDGTSSDTDDLIAISFYISDINAIDESAGIYLTLDTVEGNDLYEYYYDDFHTTLVTGWNNTYIDKGSFSEVGSPDWSNINLIYLQFESYATYEDEYITFGLISMIKEVSTGGGGGVPQPLDTTDSPTFAGLTLSGLTADRVIYANGSKQLTSSSITSTELAYLSGLNQNLTTTTNVQFGDIKIYEAATNLQAKLDLENRQSSPTGNNSRCEIKMNSYNNAAVETSRIMWYNRGNKLGELIMEIGSFYATGGSYLFKLNGSTKLEITQNGNILVNGAYWESSSVGNISIYKGTEPSTSTADQITIFPTTDASTTLGLRLEEAVVSETITPDSTLRVKINGNEYKIPMELQP